MGSLHGRKHAATRFVDTLPPPTKSVEVKVVVLSPSRSATLATYRALKVLGYKTYHNYESIYNGLRDMKLFNESMRAKFHGEFEVYRRPEFEKWFQGYDALTELPSYFPEEIVEAYPRAKYILVERTPESWARSVMNSIVRMTEDVNRFPTSFLKQFDDAMYQLCSSAYITAERFSDGKFGRPGGLEACADCVALVKKIVPPEQLLVVRLEDGLDWDAICPFLQMPVPDEPFPPPFTPEVFKETVEEFMMPQVKRAVRNAAALILSPIVVLVGAVWWASDGVR
ncbi:P-loop containing nucleoside triphosphate hydrolase protein [Microdochium trichocladiopsis]|uniref:P-loop containing nucleoside triphosphate hydrolase protein n=1 Tax=Microdochium trichocladiopsis TaxID=1682393 RepID=A0A9P8Y5G1_9PEZI|nr:P-loop containing nucleoside triphosphate hydrolase protein [Microdochium trichocladiopsis]KAH7030686.1 P-loop containing nucleoside triphosphate hydrolase protein [Microdochium trichocladiopsis]